MSFFNTEKLQTAQKANLDLLQQISGKVFASVEQLSQLQFKALRESTEEQFEGVRKLMAVRDPQGFAEAAQASSNYRTLAACALDYALAGVTSVEEVLKVCATLTDEGVV
mgnify:CR=1 FL=1